MTTILQDIRYALRQLRKTPGFTITAVLTLALGIGANAAIFTLVNAVLLRNLPVVDPHSIVRIGDQAQCCVNSGTSTGGDQSLFSTDTYQHFRADNPEFTDLAAMEAGYEYRSPTVRRDGGLEQAHSVMAEFVSGNYFNMFGLQPAAGRLMANADDKEGAPITAMMAYDTWTNTYNRDPSIIGSTFWVNTKPVTVIGILPSGFYGDRLRVSPPQFYLPLSYEPEIRGTTYEHNPDADYLWFLGRLKQGVDRATLQQKLSLQLRQRLAIGKLYSSEKTRPLLARQHVVLIDGGEGIQDLQRNYGSHLKLLMWISGLVLLIACANIANLLLVRGMNRKAELAVRAAMGASRTRIIRQLITESLVLAVISGVAALAVSYAGARLLVRMAFPNQPVPINAEPSLLVFGFALVLSLVTAIIFGIAPAIIAAGAEPADVLRGSSRTTTGGSSVMQRVLVIAQAGLSLVLLVGAGLFAQSLGKLENSDMKLNPVNRYVIHFDPQTAGYKPSQVYALYRTIQNQFHVIPGVVKVGLSAYSPMEDNNSSYDIQIQGKPETGHGASVVQVSPEYFDAVGTRIVQGRDIGMQDTPTSPTVVVVNQSFVKTFFNPGENPIGHRLGQPGPASSGDLEIVGVVEDTTYSSVRWADHQMIFPVLTQRGASNKGPIEQDTSLYAGTIVVETSRPIADFETISRRTLSAINPNLAVLKFQSFSAQIADQFTEERMLSRLMLIFGGLALLLATVGLYGVTSYSVARRTNEIGIRMALGAERSNVIAMILTSALTQTVIGLAIGIPAAYYCVRFVKSQLYEMSEINIAALLISVFVLLAAAFLAGLVPGRKAASIDPAQALRSE
jgi:macrolide transport system ATP-binding/permease protein